MLALLSFVELFGVEKKKIRKIFAFFIIAVFLILTTIRGGMRGQDVTYKEHFGYTDTSYLFKTQNFLFEPFYSLLQWISKKLINNFQFFLFLIGLITIGIEHKYAKTFRMGNKKIGGGGYYFTIFFVLWGLYQANIFVIRSTISLMICFYSINYIKNAKKTKFLLCVFLAAGFHYSALIFLPAYFIFWFRSRLFTKISIFIFGSIFLSFAIRPISLTAAHLLGGNIERKIRGYLNATGFMFSTGMNEESATIVLLKALLNIGLILFIGIYFWRFNKKDIDYEGYLNLYIVGCILYVATLRIGIAFARLSIYYNIFQIPILLYAIRGNGKVNNNKISYWMIFVLYIAARLLINNISFPFITYWQ